MCQPCQRAARASALNMIHQRTSQAARISHREPCFGQYGGDAGFVCCFKQVHSAAFLTFAKGFRIGRGCKLVTKQFYMELPVHVEFLFGRTLRFSPSRNTKPMRNIVDGCAAAHHTTATIGVRLLNALGVNDRRIVRKALTMFVSPKRASSVPHKTSRWRRSLVKTKKSEKASL